MSASKSFIKNAVGILIVVAICFVAVTIYKKGNASINSSISDYDEIVSQFDMKLQYHLVFLKMVCYNIHEIKIIGGLL